MEAPHGGVRAPAGGPPPSGDGQAQASGSSSQQGEGGQRQRQQQYSDEFMMFTFKVGGQAAERCVQDSRDRCDTTCTRNAAAVLLLAGTRWSLGRVAASHTIVQTPCLCVPTRMHRAVVLLCGRLRWAAPTAHRWRCATALTSTIGRSAPTHTQGSLRAAATPRCTRHCPALRRAR
jgi:hypothetical protein